MRSTRMRGPDKRHAAGRGLATPLGEVVPDQLRDEPCRGRKQKAEPQTCAANGSRAWLDGHATRHAVRRTVVAHEARHQYHRGDRYKHVRITSHTASTKCQYNEEFFTASGDATDNRPRRSAKPVQPSIRRPNATWDPWNPVIR